jgi:polyisoprenoid-binding protein YceI
VFVASCVALLLFAWGMPSAHAGRYEIVSAETVTTYETHYLKWIPVRGVFERMRGVLQYQPLKPVGEREAAIEVVIDATTLKPTTFDGEAKRKMLRGPEFFNVEKFPTIEFRSSRFRYEGERLRSIDGEITIVGVTRPVSLAVKRSGCEPASGTRAARCTSLTELVIKRGDFGMRGWATTVSDEVRIVVDMVAELRTVLSTGAEPKQPPAPPTSSSSAEPQGPTSIPPQPQPQPQTATPSAPSAPQAPK